MPREFELTSEVFDSLLENDQSPEELVDILGLSTEDINDYVAAKLGGEKPEEVTQLLFAAQRRDQRIDSLLKAQTVIVSVLPVKADQEKLRQALFMIAKEGRDFGFRFDAHTGQTLILGTGVLQLDFIVDRLRRSFNIRAEIGEPQVAYEETVTGEAEGEGRFVRQSGGRGQYGHAKVRVRPRTDSIKGLLFNNAIRGGAIPREFIGSVEQGIVEAMTTGPLAGFPVVGVEVDLYDGSYHAVDSSGMAFKIAGSMAFQDAFMRAHPALMEPVMDVEVVTPEDYMGEVISDITLRRGRVQQMGAHGDSQIIHARVPLSEMFSYDTELHSLSQGRANFSMRFVAYELAPKEISEQIVSTAIGRRERG